MRPRHYNKINVAIGYTREWKMNQEKLEQSQLTEWLNDMTAAPLMPLRLFEMELREDQGQYIKICERITNMVNSDNPDLNVKCFYSIEYGNNIDVKVYIFPVLE